MSAGIAGSSARAPTEPDALARDSVSVDSELSRLRSPDVVSARPPRGMWFLSVAARGAYSSSLAQVFDLAGQALAERVGQHGNDGLDGPRERWRGPDCRSPEASQYRLVRVHSSGAVILQPQCNAFLRCATEDQILRMNAETRSFVARKLVDIGSLSARIARIATD